MSQRAVYRESELVWAKMRGHPHWPAKVMRSPKGVSRPQGKLWIFFYGTHEHAWMLPADLYCYEENREKFCLPKKIKGFAEAIWEIEEDPDLVITLGKPPSKKRRQSTPTVSNEERSWQQKQVLGAASASSLCEGKTQSQDSLPPVASFTTEDKKGLSSSSSSVGVESRDCHGKEPRYVTRRQKRGSDGIVAQITQRFAARMELKSPPTREACLGSCAGARHHFSEQTVQCGTDNGNGGVEGEEVLAGHGHVENGCVADVENKHVIMDSSTHEAHSQLMCKEEEEGGKGCERKRSGDTRKRKTQKVVRQGTRSSGRLACMARDNSSSATLHNESATLEVEPGNEPAVSEVEPGNEPAVSEVEPENEPAVSEVEPENEPAVSEVEPENEPAVSEVEPENEPAVSEVEPENEPAVSEVEPENEPGNEQAVSEVEPGNEPAVSEVEPENEPAVSEVEPENEPAVLEVEPENEMAGPEIKGENADGGVQVIVQSSSVTTDIKDSEGSDRIEASMFMEGNGQAAEEVCEGDPAVTAVTVLAECDVDKKNGHTDSIDTDLSREQTGSTGSEGVEVSSQHAVGMEEDITCNGEALPQLCVQKLMSTADVLMALNYNLKASLTTQAPNVQEAKAVLHELLNVQYTSHELCRVPDLVATIRKVRQFYGNDVVRSRAEEVYSAMKSSFLSPGQLSRLGRLRSLPRGTVRPPMMTSQGRAGGQAPNKTGKGPAAKCKAQQAHYTCRSARNLQPVKSNKCDSSDQTVPSIGPA